MIKKFKDDNAILPLYSPGYMNSMGTTYDMAGVQEVYNESASDMAPPYVNGELYISDPETKKPRYDIANEHGALMEIKDGIVTVGEKTPKENNSPINAVAPRTSGSWKESEVSYMHTHPNEGKPAARFANGAAYFKDNGPSAHDKTAAGGTVTGPKNGYYNIVADKNIVYLYDKNNTIKIPWSKL